jgi:hypothetical protein
VAVVFWAAARGVVDQSVSVGLGGGAVACEGSRLSHSHTTTLGGTRVLARLKMLLF